MRGIRWISLLIVAVMLLMGTTGVFAAPYAQASTGQICISAYDDQNGNGARDTDEPLLADVGFTLTDSTGAQPRTYKTDGSSEPYCFTNLAPGSYTVQARAPASLDLEVTTPGQWAISLSAGAQFDVNYGGRATTKARSASSPASGPSPLGRIVLGGLGVIILAAAGFMAYLLIQRVRHT
jgi:hypothetical protein